MKERSIRTAALIGEDKVARLRDARIVLFGLGGVGGYTAEALARAGVGEMWLVDHDRISESNINRQILSLDSTIGQYKTDVAAARIKDIDPAIKVHTLPQFIDQNNIDELLADLRPHYLIDAIDSVSSKLAIAVYAQAHKIPLVACMGTGNKLDPARLRIGDIAQTHTCPLARAMRTRLRAAGIAHMDVLWSDELPVSQMSPTGEGGRCPPASISYLPAIAGLMLAGHVIRRLIGVI